jgi:aldose 1-epimerase
MATSFTCRRFGSLPSGEIVEAWTLSGAGGLVVEALTYGGIVTRLLAPDRTGSLADVVLGFDRLEAYLAGHPYFGAIVGRVAGRISGASFSLEGKTFNLVANDGPNHLHGGICGFDKKVWKATRVDRADGAPSLRLTAASPAGEEGYPGSVDVSVTYTVTDDNTFLIEAEAKTDCPTPFALAHHSYFNLAGEGSGVVEGHTLQIHSDAFVPEDEQMTLLGRLEPVAGGVDDFREPKELRDAIPKLFLNHGSLYRVRSRTVQAPQVEPVPVARLVHAPSGRVLEVSTTETYMQFYTGAFLDSALIGKSGVAYGPYSGICLECQGYPDALNAPHMDDIVLRPGEPRQWTTAYHFAAVMPEPSPAKAAR